MIASAILSVLTISALLLNLNSIDVLLLINLFLLSVGLAVVLVLDRNIPTTVHIATVYFFLFSSICLVAGAVSFLDPDISLTVFFILVTIILLYLFFPSLLQKMQRQKHLSIVSWHFSNCILACSWAIFMYVFWFIFW